MSGENGKPAETPKVGDALVAALGFEPTDGDVAADSLGDEVTVSVFAAPDLPTGSPKGKLLSTDSATSETPVVSSSAPPMPSEVSAGEALGAVTADVEAVDLDPVGLDGVETADVAIVAEPSNGLASDLGSATSTEDTVSLADVEALLVDEAADGEPTASGDDSDSATDVEPEVDSADDAPVSRQNSHGATNGSVAADGIGAGHNDERVASPSGSSTSSPSSTPSTSSGRPTVSAAGLASAARLDDGAVAAQGVSAAPTQVAATPSSPPVAASGPMAASSPSVVLPGRAESPAAEATPMTIPTKMPAATAPAMPAGGGTVTGDGVVARQGPQQEMSVGDRLSGAVIGIPGLLDTSMLKRTRRVRARKVRRVVRHVDPWSVLTFSVLFHLCVFAALLLASVLVWNAAVAAGTIENIEDFIRDLGDYRTFEINGDVVFRAAMVIAGILTLASSLLMVLLTVVFNLISDLVGGIRVTVVEEETVRVRRRGNQ